MDDQARSDWFSRDTLRQWLPIGLVFIVACLDRQFQTDFWMHLARGAEIVRTGDFIHFDHFTLTGLGSAVRDPNWLSQVIYFRLFSLGGLPLVQAVNATVLAATMALLVRFCRARGASSLAAGLAGVITFLLAWQTFLIRPQTFSMLLFALLYFTLCRGKTVALLTAVPAILLLWVNLHGGFLIGLILIALCAVVGSIRSLWATQSSDDDSNPMPIVWVASGLLSLAATLFNPSGWHVYQYAFSLTRRVMPRHIQEWMPPALNQWMGIALLGSAILLALLHFRCRRLPGLRDGVLLICFFPLAMHSVRMVVWWAMVAMPILADLLTESIHQSDSVPTRLSRVVNTAFCMSLLSLCIISLPQMERWNPMFHGLRSPHRTEADLQQLADSALVADNSAIFTRLEWGQYLDWPLGPTGRVFMDGHIELVSDAQWRDYCLVSSGSTHWQAILDRYHIDNLLLDRSYHGTLLSAVKSSPNWEQHRSAGEAVLFVRKASLVSDSRGRRELPDSISSAN